MKNFKVNLPLVLAITLAVTVTSCENERRVEEYNKTKLLREIPSFEQVFERTEKVIEETPIDEIIIPEGLILEDTETTENTEETGFSK